LELLIADLYIEVTAPTPPNMPWGEQ
jgi:hypothetical protein